MAKPLTICVHPDLMEQPWVKALIDAGHVVTDSDMEVWAADLVLGPTCCRFLPGMEAFLPSIIKGARKVRYPAKEKA